MLAHEQTIPSRVDRLVAAWRESGIQQTPVMLFGEVRWIVADGHHRLAAARKLGVRVAAAVVARPAILPAHRVIHRAPAGWVERMRRAIPLKKGHGPLAIATASGTDCFDCGGMGAVDQMRLLWEASDLDGPGVEWSIEGDREKALAAIGLGAAAVILVPAIAMEDVVAAAESGVLLPPRSTNFQPKPAESSIRFRIGS